MNTETELLQQSAESHIINLTQKGNEIIELSSRENRKKAFIIYLFITFLAFKFFFISFL